jgi:hypothetical protein
VCLLLESGALVEREDDDCGGQLHRAIDANCSVNIFRTLVGYGSDVSRVVTKTALRDVGGTPLDVFLAIPTTLPRTPKEIWEICKLLSPVDKGSVCPRCAVSQCQKVVRPSPQITASSIVAFDPPTSHSQIRTSP